MLPDYTKSIAAHALRDVWRYASAFALITTTILFATGLDSYLDEMKTLHWKEVAGLTYFLFVLPWYLTIIGAVALRCWPRAGGEIHIPQNYRLVHLLNFIFLVPGIVAPLMFLYSIMMWAFGPNPTVIECIIVLMFIAIVQFFIAKTCWRFVKGTIRSLFLPPQPSTNQ